MRSKSRCRTEALAFRVPEELFRYFGGPEYVLFPSGRGSGDDLAARVAGNCRFIVESGAVLDDPPVNIEGIVDASFLPLK
jgi:hypothetical protein